MDDKIEHLLHHHWPRCPECGSIARKMDYRVYVGEDNRYHTEDFDTFTCAGKAGHEWDIKKPSLGLETFQPCEEDDCPMRAESEDENTSLEKTPVHQDSTNHQWYFWDETWTDRLGPYETREEAAEACKEYDAENL